MGLAHGIRRHKRAHPRTWILKRFLLSVLVVGGLSFFTLGGTFASLTSESSNRNGSITTGTLVVSNTVGTGSACFSYNGTANSNGGCNPLISSSVGTPNLQYPGTAYTVHVAVSNTGSVGAGNLSVYMPNCNGASVPSSPGAPSPGGGDPCGANGVMMYIDESNSTFTSHSCVYPTSGGTCSFSASTLYFLKATKYDTSHLYSLNEGLAAGQTRYYIVGLELPSTAANALQGEEAQFDLTWLASQ